MEPAGPAETNVNKNTLRKTTEFGAEPAGPVEPAGLAEANFDKNIYGMLCNNFPVGSCAETFPGPF